MVPSNPTPINKKGAELPYDNSALKKQTFIFPENTILLVILIFVNAMGAGKSHLRVLEHR